MVFAKNSKVFIFIFSSMITSDSYNWYAFLILNLFQKFTKYFESSMWFKNLTHVHLLPLIDAIIVGPKRSKCINSRGLLVETSSLLLEQLHPIDLFPIDTLKSKTRKPNKRLSSHNGVWCMQMLKSKAREPNKYSSSYSWVTFKFT